MTSSSPRNSGKQAGLQVRTYLASLPADARKSLQNLRKAIRAAALGQSFLEPAVAAKVAAWVNYICPVKGAQEEMRKIDRPAAESELATVTERECPSATRRIASTSAKTLRKFQVRPAMRTPSSCVRLVTWNESTL